MMPVKKDQGWAWVVLVACAASLYIFIILSATTGFFQVEIMEDLGVGSGPISIMSSLALGQACVCGPLSGLLASLLSVRVTVLLGISLLSGGLVMASFAQSLASLTFFYGFITGFGFGIAYTACIIIISLYFERHRLLANGIIMCAPGLGLLSHPHLITWAIGNHGWRWACTLMGGIVLHIAVLASLFFPTDTERQTMIDWRNLWNKWKNEESYQLEQDKEMNKEENWEEKEPLTVLEGKKWNLANKENEDWGENENLFKEFCAKINSKPENFIKDNIVGIDSMCKCYHEDGEDGLCKKETGKMGTEEKANSKICRCVKKIKEHCKIAKESRKDNNVPNNTKTEDDMKADIINEMESLKKESINNFINDAEFSGNENLKVIVPSDKKIDYILKWEESSAKKSSLTSLPLTLSRLGSISGCPSPIPKPAVSHIHRNPLLNDFIQQSGSDNNLHKKSQIPGTFLGISIDNFDKGRSLNASPRKRSTSCVSNHSYNSWRAHTKLQNSHISITSNASGLRGRANSWLQSQADVMGSSLLLPIKIEEMETEQQEASLKKNLNLVFQSKSIWILCINSFCFTFGYGMHSVHFPAFAEHQGVSRDYISQFFTVYGIVMMLARLGGGIMLNRLTKPPLVLMSSVLQIFLGLFLALAIVYATKIEGLYVMQIGIALTYGIGYMLYAPICVEALGVDLIAISFGLVQLFHGIAYIISPVIAGFLYDATGTFDVPLVLGGSVVAVGALPLLFVKCMTPHNSEDETDTLA